MVWVCLGYVNCSVDTSQYPAAGSNMREDIVEAGERGEVARKKEIA